MTRKVNPRLQRNFIGLDGFVWAIGIVEDIADPLKIGRAKVRYMGWHCDDKSKMPTELLPWSHPIAPLFTWICESPLCPPSKCCIKIPALILGDWVLGFFQDGVVAQKPIMLGILPAAPAPA